MAPRKQVKVVHQRSRGGGKRAILEAVELLRSKAPELLEETHRQLRSGMDVHISDLAPDDAVVGTTVIRGASHDAVNHPSHYKGANGLECVDCQEAAVGDSPLTGFQAHLIATITGYAFRCGKKGDALEDARKLQWYANKLVSSLTPKEV